MKLIVVVSGDHKIGLQFEINNIKERKITFIRVQCQSIQ